MGHSVLQVGGKGSAYDPPNARRAFTYDDQPGNEIAWRLGEAARLAVHAPTGDCIDRGLLLLKGLKNSGFGVFQIGTTTAPAAPAAAVPVDVIEAARSAYKAVKVYSTGETSTGEIIRTVSDLERNEASAWRAAIDAALVATHPQPAAAVTQEMCDAGTAAMLAFRKSGSDWTDKPAHAARVVLEAAIGRPAAAGGDA